MLPITETKGSELQMLKAWASQPWQTNYIRIPGLQALEYNSELFTQKVIATFCPHAISPTREHQNEEDLQCVKIREGGAPDMHCGMYRIAPMGADTPSVCAEQARESGGLAFMLGKGVEKGKCAIVSMAMTDELFEHFQADRRDPACPGGGWEANPFWDVYACKALEDPCGPGSGYGHLDLATASESGNLVDGPMMFSNVGNVPDGTLDLEVTAGSSYTAKNTKQNKINGAFGQVNVKTCTSTDLTFTFQVGGSEHTMPEFVVTFFDLDTSKKPDKMWEAITGSGFEEMYKAPAPFYTTSSDGPVKATVHGVGADNPSDPMMLTPEQISRSVGFLYKDTSSFTVHLDAHCGYGNSGGGRNFLFAFHSSLTPCRI
jgi:hypothetical protein